MKHDRHHSCLNCIFRRAEILHQVINNSPACFEKTLVGDFPGGPAVKNLPANTGDTSLITGPGRCHMLWAAKPMMPEFPRAHAPQQEKPPLATTREKPTHCNEDPLQLKIKIKKDFWLELKFFKRGRQVLGWESESNHWGVCILFSEKPLMERRQNNLFYSFSL